MTSRQAAHSHTDIRRSHQRFHTEISWLDFHHSFSFSNHYDPQVEERQDHPRRFYYGTRGNA
jgi:hypothetical protein